MSEQKPSFDENPPPGKYVRMTLLPQAGPGELSPSEIARPFVEPARRVRSHLLAVETVSGKYTPEELTWPVVDTGSEVITPSAEALSSESEPQIGHIAREVGELLSRTPPAERPLLLQRLQGLLARLSAEQSAA